MTLKTNIEKKVPEYRRICKWFTDAQLSPPKEGFLSSRNFIVIGNYLESTCHEVFFQKETNPIGVSIVTFMCNVIEIVGGEPKIPSEHSHNHAINLRHLD